MANYTYQISIKEKGKDWVDCKTALIPFYITHTLDETLDTGKINLQATRRKSIIPPFTPVRIKSYCAYPSHRDENNEKVYNTIEGDTIYMLVFNDQAAQITPDTEGSTPYYNHVLELIEPTKLLERHLCDTLTFTNRIAHSFGDIELNAEPTINGDTSGIKSFPKYNIYQKSGGVLIINSIKNAFTFNNSSTVWDMAMNGIDVYENDILIARVINDIDKSLSISLNSSQYKIEYRGDYFIDKNRHVLKSCTYNLTAVEDIPATPPWSITNVLNRILEVGETRREGIDQQAFTLDPKIAEKYANMQAPEFYITRSTIFEALLQVGSFIHAIPRLVWNPITDKPDIVTFDMLGGSDEYQLPSYCIKNYDIKGQTLEEYSGYIDSIAENVINTSNPLEGSIETKMKTMRTEEGQVIISNDTACIITELPIYRVIKLEMGYIDVDRYVGDITPFLYESAEYDTLSAYGTDYPYSMMYALRYTQGDNKITQFGYQAPTAIGVKQPVIYNILDKLGKPSGNSLKNFAFKVTYIPIESCRVRQYKAYNMDFPSELGLISNQGANTVEGGFYGENLKGLISRMGNVTEKVNYYFKRVNTLPKVGQKFQGSYISGVEMQFDNLCIKCTMTLSPNFNRLSAYIGLNSNFRLYDVSEKQSVDRHMNYGSHVSIGDIQESYNTGMNMDGVRVFATTFNNYPPLIAPISGAIITLKTGGGKYQIGTKLYLNANSIAMGNSIALLWQFVDNFGVGYTSRYLDTARDTQVLVRAGTEYGEFTYMDIDYVISGFIEPTYGEQLTGLPHTSPEIYGKTDTLPLLQYRDLNVQKDSKEKIIMTSQLHLSANRHSIVLGKALTSNNTLVLSGRTEKDIKIVLFENEINMLNPIESAGTMHILRDIEDSVITVGDDDYKFVINPIVNTTNNSYKAWGIVDNISNTLYIGENMDINAGAETLAIYFNF